MSPKRIAALASIGLGIISLFTPNMLEALWTGLNYSDATRPWLTATVAVLFFVAIPILTLQLEIEDLPNKIGAKPDLKAMSNAEAMDDASKCFRSADIVLNTRMITGDVDQFDQLNGSWEGRLISSIKAGTRVRELMSENCEKFAKRRRETIASTTQVGGLYECSIVPVSLGGSFVNFVIVTREGKKTMWFGWLISKGTTHDIVYRTERADLIEMFEQHFNAQFREGRPAA